MSEFAVLSFADLRPSPRGARGISLELLNQTSRDEAEGESRNTHHYKQFSAITLQFNVRTAIKPKHHFPE